MNNAPWMSSGRKVPSTVPLWLILVAKEGNHGWQERVYSRTDYREAQRGGGSPQQGIIDIRSLSKNRSYGRNVLSVAQALQRHADNRSKTDEGNGKENARLRKLVSDLSIDNQILKEVAKGNF
jgi:hypothetical protein